jgi:hypothetical protein
MLGVDVDHLDSKNMKEIILYKFWLPHINLFLAQLV